MLNELPIFSGYWSWVWIIGGAALILWYLTTTTTTTA
jgi:hypothetical protein